MATGGGRRLRLAGAVTLPLLCIPLAVGLAQTTQINPYTGQPEAIQTGRALFLQNGCSACHGVMGGGGMGPQLLDPNWKFGGDDTTLFKLIKGQIPQQTMPKIFTALPDDEVWKLIAYVRSLYRGEPSRIVW